MDKKSEKLAAAYIYIGIAAVSIGAGGAYGWPLGVIVAGTCIATLGVYAFAALCGLVLAGAYCWRD